MQARTEPSSQISAPAAVGAASAAVRDNLIAQARADAIRKNGVPTLVANLVCGLSIAFIAARTPAPAWIVYSWIGALCVVLIGRYCLLRAYSSPALSRAPERWLRLHVSGTFIAGAIWAAGTVFLPYASGSDADLTILFVLVGIVAGGITSSVVYLPLMAAFVMPILAAVSIHFFLHRSVDGFVGGLLVFVFAAYAVRSARAFQNGFAEQVAMRVDNQRLVGQLEDAMARLEERKEYFRVIADYSFSWEIWFEADGSLRWVSPGVLGVTGYSQQEFYDRPSLAAEIIHEDDRERILRGMKVAALQPTTKEIEFRIRCKDGTERWCSTLSRPAVDSLGRNCGYRASVRDISERKALQEKLERQASQDPLTGLPNRRRFFEAADRDFQRAKRYRRPLAIAVIDVDHFKSINDRYGHLAGDECLSAIGAMLGSRLRKSDLVARLGGEEFVILFTETALTAGITVCENLRKHLAAEPIVTYVGKLPTTICIGLSQLKPDDTDVRQILARADAALYEAKHRGRNRVVADCDMPPAPAAAVA